MSLYKKRGSPFWWYSIAAEGTYPRVRASTKIRHDAPTKEQRKENEHFARVVEYEARAARTKARISAPPPTKPEIGVSDYLTWYEAHVASHHKGYVREASMLKQLRQALGDGRLRELTLHRLLEWRTQRATEVSAGTVNRERDLLVAALNQAVPTYLDTSPANGLSRLPHRASVPAVLSHADEAKLLQVLAPPDRAILIAALDTLARAGDLARLTWADDHGQYLTFRDPKTGKPYEVPISTRLRAALDTLDKAPGQRIFHHRLSANPRPMEFWRMLREACLKAGVTAGRKQDGLTFHALRHTGASRLAAAGVDLRTIQALGGWSSLKQLSRYAHPTHDHMVNAVELIGPEQSPKVTRAKKWR